MEPLDLGISVLGVASFLASIAGILIAVHIARKQKFQSYELESIVRNLDPVVRNIEKILKDNSQYKAEQEAKSIEEEADSHVDEEEPTLDDEGMERPSKEDAYIAALNRRDTGLNTQSLRWRRKERPAAVGARGNLGWFVEDTDPNNNDRWFIHHGRGWTVRPAVPRDLLELWKKNTGQNPQEIRLDYQTGSGSGNHSWYVETYKGDTWRLYKGNGGAKCEKLDEE